MSKVRTSSYSNTQILQRVYSYVKPYRSLFYFSLILTLLLAIIAPVRGYLIQVMVDKGLKESSAGIPAWLNNWLDKLSGFNVVEFIIQIFIIQIVLLFLETLFRFLFTYITAKVGQNVVNDLRKTVFNKVLSLPLSFFDKTPIGTLTTRTVNDIESINEIFSDGLIPIIADILIIIFTLGTMFWMDWRLTLICLIPFPILIIATYFFKESVNRSFISVRNAVASLNAFAQEHLTGMALVQSFTAEDREFKKFEKINTEHKKANIKSIFAYSVFFPVVEIVLALSIGLLVWWIANFKIEAGKLIAFILFLNQIFRPLRMIADKFNVLQMGIISSERVFVLMDTPCAETAERIPDPWPKTFNGHITFKNVSFEYKPNVPVLRNISFDIPAGRSLAIVGSTGSGKSTIISLINRLYNHQSGEILIDGIDNKDIPLATLRHHIGVVLQDVFLFNGSVLDNLTLRNPDVSFEQVQHATRLLGIHDFIMSLPGNYDFKVLERGASLSMGQRQLLSFARCLIYNPAILILDEATSNIDTESELLIQNAIDTLMKGRTSIIIAHRLSTIQKADHILVLDKGEVVEYGTHYELLAEGKNYAKLYEMQFKNNPA
ncbi:ABC transporter ATP-binding protein [Polluticaenibacter yanchengensis]|uniref:ABC transporter ATP-binding protein n=1 Tax=Polluticaenibacter yanchengensis TaxID=3014562 RepID=A0ABT4UFY4_9BACT|nr:ABC transporter ATP-binding protein [Chitinophagaceae bacterium LY-5]